MKLKLSYLINFYIFIFPFFYFGFLLKIPLLILIIILMVFSTYTHNVSFSKKFLFILLISILLFYILNTIFSIVYVKLNFNFDLSKILIRAITQIFKFILVLLEIYLGFVLFEYIKKETFIKIIIFSIITTVILAIYQNIAYIKGWPMWGLYLFENSKYAIDIKSGFRNNALCGEPKYLAVYMVVAFFFVLDLTNYYISKIFKFILLALILFVFFKTASGNGILAFLLLLFFKFYLKNKKYFITLLFIVPIIFIVFMNTYQYFIFRPSVLYILESIKQLNFKMSYMDDLIYLPWLAWIHYWFMLLFGFGLGLLHFYAANFIEYAKWFNLKNGGYIDSNLYIMSFISNFGIVFTLILIYYMFASYNRNIRIFNNDEDQLILNFSIYSFLVGLIVGGDLTIYFYISIGIMLFYNYSRRYVYET